MDNNINYSSEVKKGLIGLLMFTLYSDEKTIYREYVQNALDSINSAIEQGILAQTKDGIVNIIIDAHKKRIVIKDNGTGISADNAIRILLDISATNKDGVNQAGQFGIGRLVGGGYCHELIFRTTAKGESIGTQVLFDVDKIWRMVKEDSTDYLASHVIDVCTRKEHFKAPDYEHYFEVILNGVKDDSAPALLDHEEVINYLNAVAPVGYKSAFYNVLIYKSTKDNPKFKTLHENLEKVQLFVGKTPIQKQYDLSIHGTKDEIKNLEYFVIEDDRFGELGWGWFALTKFTIQIPKEDKLACIRLRKHNIQIGDYNQLSGNLYWKEERSNSYFYGEFFVTHPNIVPNAARDGLAPTPETNALNNGLREYFESLKSLYTKANEAKKSIDKIREGIERFKKTRDIDDYNAKDLIDNKGIGKFEKLLKSASIPCVKRMLMLYKADYDQAKMDAQEIKNQLSPTTGKSRIPEGCPSQLVNTVSFVSGTVSTEPVNTTHKPTIEENEVITCTDKPKLRPEVDKSASDNTVIKEPEHEPEISPFIAQQDIISPLQAILEPTEVWTIRRIFRVLNTYCPKNAHDKNLIIELQKLIVKEFSNGL